jgi:NADH dehydrogenase (ubiquinone) Fe-S protein 6
MSATSLRSLGGLRLLRVPSRALSTTPRRPDANTATPTSVAEATSLRKQAPNRVEVWARGQKDRKEAMTGPRFEQTDFSVQVSVGQPLDGCVSEWGRGLEACVVGLEEGRNG